MPNSVKTKFNLRNIRLTVALESADWPTLCAESSEFSAIFRHCRHNGTAQNTRLQLTIKHLIKNQLNIVYLHFALSQKEKLQLL